MSCIILGIKTDVLREISDMITDIDPRQSIYEPHQKNYYELPLCDITLIDAWLEIVNEHVFICYDDIKIFLPRSCFSSAVFTV